MYAIRSYYADALYAIDYEQELANLGSIAGALFDILNGAGFIGGDGSVDQITIDGETVRDLFTDMADSEVILMITESLLLPMLTNSEGEFSAIRITSYNVCYTKLLREFIDRTELIATIDALNVLGINDIENVTIDVSYNFV